MNSIFIYFLILMSAFFWGSNFNAASHVVQHVDPLFAASERFILASIFIIIYCIVFRIKIMNSSVKNFILMAVLGIIGITGLNVFFFIGIKYTSAMNGALIMSTSPITTYILSILFYKSEVTYKKILGLMISLVGVACVIFHGSLSNVLNFSLNKGDAYILLSNLSMAIYTIGCKNWITDAKPIQVTTFSMIFGTLGILGISIFLSGTGLTIDKIQNISQLDHSLLLYMALAGSILAYLFWNYGIQTVGPSNTSIFFNFVPIFTMLISFCQGDIPNTYQMAGVVLVIIGVITTTQSRRIINQATLVNN